mgnify:CR=1 FL=1
MLVLASTSPYRRELLQRLRLPFDCARPDVDETPWPDEPVPAMVARLARAKAEAVLAHRTGDQVIGSDQAAELDGRPLGKPGSREGAIAQLEAMSGRSVRFHTAVCVADADRRREAVDLTTVRFRPLSRAEIVRYVEAELPLDCAGSFKCEGLGISLFEAIESSDPTALIGLPLITLARLLRETGVQAP